MVKVFVHGVPETDVVWNTLIAELDERFIDDRMVRLSPPGFGAPIPDGWAATPPAYVDWLEARLVEIIDEEAAAERFPEIDLVGHDWGAGHVFGLVAKRPDLVRTWAIDCAGLLNADYVWHDIAQQWQTADVGEAVVDYMTAMSVADRAASYVEFGLSADDASAMAQGFTPEMGSCILNLYRAAVQPAMAEKAEDLFAALDGLGPDAPSVCLITPLLDPYVPADLVPMVAARLAAEEIKLADAGHWWMASPGAAATAADALLMFWRTHGTA